MRTLITSIQHCARSLAKPNMPEKKKKKPGKTIQLRKEEVKLYLFADDMTFHIKNSKESSKILLGLK